jgi:hypothetical protein
MAANALARMKGVSFFEECGDERNITSNDHSLVELCVFRKLLLIAELLAHDAR